MPIIAEDGVFARWANQGYVLRHNTGKPIVVIRSAPGKLLFNDGTIVISDSMARAVREFDVIGPGPT